jgi:succinate dehydrogenase/fumarate reductase-like Fe-S protein
MSPEQRAIKVTVFRFNPYVDENPHYKVYEVPFIEGSTISTVLLHINEEHDGGLAHYLSCRRGICAGCMVRVNGKTALACTELVRGDVTIEPVNQDQVVKDLVICSEKPTTDSI